MGGRGGGGDRRKRLVIEPQPKYLKQIPKIVSITEVQIFSNYVCTIC